ncbi:MAG: TldD/PmbA family protein [Candidatus Latescibacterota bacterium]
MARRRGASAEVFQTERSTIETTFEAGKLKTAERKSLLGVGLRVIREGRLGFAAASDVSRLDDLVDSALASARFGKEAGFGFPGPGGSGAEASFDPAIESYGPADAIAEGRRAVEALRECCPKALTDVSISASVTSVRIANTSGLDARYRSTDFQHSATSIIVEGDSILWVADGGHYGTLDIRTDDYVRKISDLARKAQTKAPKVSGKLPVIFVAQEFPNLLQSIELGANGRRLVKGDSPLVGREGEKMLGHVTIYDNPFRTGAPGSRPFDDEGVPSQRTALFEEGIFRSFLFDLDTASQAGRASTGNAARGMLSAPSVGMSNLVLSPGDTDFEHMIRDLREGIIVYGVLGGGQSNLLAGDFALNVMLGFLIREGEIAGRLVDTMVSGNVYQAFGAIGALGKEVRPVGTHFVPDVLFSELSVSSR